MKQAKSATKSTQKRAAKRLAKSKRRLAPPYKMLEQKW
jgi:hypothetical protein